MKKKLIVTAVAGALAAPMVMAEEGDKTVTLYGRINNAIGITDIDGGDTTTDVTNVSSRIGVRASSDLGNGLTATGRYEFSTFTDREGNGVGTAVDVDGDGAIDAVALGNGRGGINDTRIGTVGLSGSFGSITAGNQWSTYFNIVGTHMSPTYSLGYYIYSSVGGGPFRASNTVQYSNSWGPVNVSVDTRFSQDTADVEKIGGDNGKDFLDGYGIGVSAGIGESFTIAAALDQDLNDTGDDADRVGIAGDYSWGDGHVAVGLQNFDNGSSDVDTYTIYFHQNWGPNRLLIGYGGSDTGGDADPSQIILGYYKNLGGGFRLYGESVWYDADTGSGADGDFARIFLGMRYDF